MCNPISWIQRWDAKGRMTIKYLTTDDFLSPKFEKFVKSNDGWFDDLPGHGAIAYFYRGYAKRRGSDVDHRELNFVGSVTSFGTAKRKAAPRDYPTEIAQAMKDGKFKYIFVAPELLTKEARKVYLEAEDRARVAFDRKMRPHHKDWGAGKISDKAFYAARSEDVLAYHKRTHNVFWKLWADPKNRVRSWR